MFGVFSNMSQQYTPAKALCKRIVSSYGNCAVELCSLSTNWVILNLEGIPLMIFWLWIFTGRRTTKSFGTIVICLLIQFLTLIRWLRNWWRHHNRTRNSRALTTSFQLFAKLKWLNTDNFWWILIFVFSPFSVFNLKSENLKSKVAATCDVIYELWFPWKPTLIWMYKA